MEEVPHGDVPSCCLAVPAELRMGKDVGEFPCSVETTTTLSALIWAGLICDKKDRCLPAWL